MALSISAGERTWRRAGRLLGAVVLVAVIFLFVSAAVPQVVGADRSFVVRSSSMSPAITAGSIVYVNDVPAERVSDGDVITYRSEVAEGRVTHRVVAVVERDGRRLFRTKGDANEEPDPRLVSPDQVVGEVAFAVPYIGYVVAFAGTSLGIALLVVVPAVLLGAMELRELLVARGGEKPESEGGETG